MPIGMNKVSRSSKNPIDIPDSGVSRWEFEDTGDTSTTTDSWDSNPGTINGASYTTTSQVGSNALSFNSANNDHIVVSHNSNLEPSELSVSCWFQTTQDVIGWIVGKDGPNFNLGYTIRLRGDEPGVPVEWSVSDTSSSTSSVDSTTDVNDGSWYHVVGTLGSSNGQTIYINGTEEATGSNSTISYNQTDFYMGARTGSDQFFDGIIDDPRVYNKELTATEVSNLYNNDSI